MYAKYTVFITFFVVVVCMCGYLLYLWGRFRFKFTIPGWRGQMQWSLTCWSFIAIPVNTDNKNHNQKYNFQNSKMQNNSMDLSQKMISKTGVEIVKILSGWTKRLCKERQWLKMHLSSQRLWPHLCIQLQQRENLSFKCKIRWLALPIVTT